MPGRFLRSLPWVIVRWKGNIFVKIAHKVVFEVKLGIKWKNCPTNEAAEEKETSYARNHFDSGKLGQNVHFLLLIRNFEWNLEPVRIVLSKAIRRQSLN